jgi:hypothetical protein
VNQADTVKGWTAKGRGCATTRRPSRFACLVYSSESSSILSSDGRPVHARQGILAAVVEFARWPQFILLLIRSAGTRIKALAGKKELVRPTNLSIFIYLILLLLFVYENFQSISSLFVYLSSVLLEIVLS